jgi:hypothetical protein
MLNTIDGSNFENGINLSAFTLYQKYCFPANFPRARARTALKNTKEAYFKGLF